MKQFIAILLLCAGVTAYGQGQPCVADSCCLEGTIWDEVLGGCVVANVSDTDFDGCVGINDFLVHLSNFGIGCGPEPTWETCGDPLGYQGYYYETVQVGGQCWFAENLKAQNYSNGDGLYSQLSSVNWAVFQSGAWSTYGANSTTCEAQTPFNDACNPEWSASELGLLYNWYAVNDSRGLCPVGWHVPTDVEWTVMTDYLGGLSVAGNKLKKINGWGEGTEGTNESGFSAIPTGRRDGGDGNYYGAGVVADWWTSTSSEGGKAWSRYLHDAPFMSRFEYAKDFGFSIRCIKDTE